jgi:hypothetical protein
MARKRTSTHLSIEPAPLWRVRQVDDLGAISGDSLAKFGNRWLRLGQLDAQSRSLCLNSACARRALRI